MKYLIGLSSLSIFIIGACNTSVDSMNVKGKTKEIIVNAYYDNTKIEIHELGNKIHTLISECKVVEGDDWGDDEDLEELALNLNILFKKPDFKKYKATLEKFLIDNRFIEVKRNSEIISSESTIIENKVEKQYVKDDLSECKLNKNLKLCFFKSGEIFIEYRYLSEYYWTEISKSKLDHTEYMLVGPCHPCIGLFLSYENKYIIAHLPFNVNKSDLRDFLNDKNIKNKAIKSKKVAILYTTYSNELLERIRLSSSKKLSIEEILVYIENNIYNYTSFFKENEYDYDLYKIEVDEKKTSYEESLVQEACKYILFRIEKNSFSVKNYFPINEEEIENINIQKFLDKENLIKKGNYVVFDKMPFIKIR